MRRLTALLILCAAVSASAEDHDAQADGLRHGITLEHELFVGGFVPGAVLRPEGDAVIKDVPNANSQTGLELNLGLGPLSVDFRPFMRTVANKNGPKVVGLHYEIMLTPFACTVPKEGKWDVPWRQPCLQFGYAHISEHNQDDGTNGWAYTNALLLRLRLRSSNEGRGSIWLWAEYVPSSGMTPFALTPVTEAPASHFESRLWLVGTDSTLRVGKGGTFTSKAELRSSREGPASIGDTTRFLQDIDIGLSGKKAFTIQVGAEIGMEYNLRKAVEFGRSAFHFAVVLALPMS